jgi:hypothetical protein
MAKDRDWVDYANVAANVVQTTQLHGLNSKMRELAELELLKESREQHETAVAKCENLLRDAVFVYSEQLRDLEEFSNRNSVVAYIRANHLKRLYANIPQFKASGFRKFEDKERLANVQRSCDRLIGVSAARLKPGELESCDRCVTHICDRDDLLRLIEAQKEKEQLSKDRASEQSWKAAKQAELERAKEEERTTTPTWFKFVITLRNISLVCTFAGLGWLGLVVLYYGNQDPPFLAELPIALVYMVPILFLTYIITVFSGKTGLKKRAFEKRYARIHAEIVTRGYEFSQRDFALKASEALYTKFGKADSEGYRKRLREQDALLLQVMGDCAKEFIQRELPPDDRFDLLLIDYPATREKSLVMAIEQSLIPSITRTEASAIVKATPYRLLHRVSKARAEALAQALATTGAKVELSSVSSVSPEPSW